VVYLALPGSQAQLDLDALRQGLRELGYAEGQNIVTRCRRRVAACFG